MGDDMSDGKVDFSPEAIYHVEAEPAREPGGERRDDDRVEAVTHQRVCCRQVGMGVTDMPIDDVDTGRPEQCLRFDRLLLGNGTRFALGPPRQMLYGCCRAAGSLVNAYSVTGTVDHALTDNLTAKVEVRWDNDDTSPFIQGSDNNQVVAIGQIMYEF